MSSPVGTILGGRYEIDEVIGRGGMSTVYRAHDLTLERWVAVKIMHREVARESEQLERFRREAKSIAKLSSPYVVGVIDADEQDQTPYIVLEYVEGQTLKQRIRDFKRLDIAEAVAFAIEVARGLEAAHERQIVHRDVKPQNVLLDEDGAARVTDFGIARQLNDESLTADGRVLGTTDYVSPEQALGHAVTPQSDLYSLGVVLFEMLTGDVPFHGENQVAVAMCHVRDELPDVQQLRPEVSTVLATVVDTATAKDLDVRYRDAHEMIADLEEALAVETARSGHITGEATAVFESLPRETRQRVAVKMSHPWRWLALIALGAVIVVGAFAYVASTAQRGTGTDNARPGDGLTAVSLSGSSAQAYDPAGDNAEHDDEAAFAVDRSPSTIWSTEDYLNGNLAKPGLGLVIDARPSLKARAIDIVSPTPGWSGRILAASGSELPASIDDPAWTEVGQVPSATARTRVRLTTDGKAFRWYLIWIERFAPGQSTVEISEVFLYR
jgi:serine/threonine-protein kinase